MSGRRTIAREGQLTALRDRWAARAPATRKCSKIPLESIHWSSRVHIEGRGTVKQDPRGIAPGEFLRADVVVGRDH